MPRFYAITVGSHTWNSQYNGVDNPNALDVEFDVFENQYGVPTQAGGSTVTIHGIELSNLQSSAQFSGLPISVSAGMSKGFPLVHPEQRGLILQGMVFQSYANWIGTEMTLDFVVLPATYTQSNPGIFVFNWQPGTLLRDALTQTIASAYANVSPQPQPVFDLTGTYTPRANGHVGIYRTLGGLAQAVKSITKYGSPDGNGVSIAFRNAANVVAVYDAGGTSVQNHIQINFTDLIGQPTWLDVATTQVTMVLRADLTVGAYIKMPQGLPYAPGSVVTSDSSFGGAPGSQQLQYKTTFQQILRIQSLRHVGNFRDPNGTSWVTVANCNPVTYSSSSSFSGKNIAP